MSRLFYNKTPRFAPVCFMLAIMYIVIFHLMTGYKDKYPILVDLDNACIVGCPDRHLEDFRKVSDWSRGDHYSLMNDEYSSNELHKCMATIWEVSHILTHGFIGYYTDIRYSAAIGVSFEIWEWWRYDCANKLDLVYNTLGCCIGAALRG